MRTISGIVTRSHGARSGARAGVGRIARGKDGAQADWTGAGQEEWLLREIGAENVDPQGDPRADAGGRRGMAGGRVAVVVLGMHRSGTSAMTRVFSLLGCGLPATLMPGRKGNEAGHWESEAICAFNDAALESAGCGWADWGAVRAGWYGAPTYADWLARARALIRQEFGQDALFVMKDPRLCRLAPLWLQALAREQVAARVVLTLRHPWEVACSLERRDGMGAARAHLLWLAHMLEAERASRGMVRMVCGYDRLMASGEPGDLEALAQDLGAGLGVAWPRLSPRVLGEMGAFLDPAARHHRVAELDGDAGRALRGWAGQVHGVLARWAATGEETARDHAELDAIGAAMTAAEADLARLVEEGERERVAACESRARVAAVEAELAQVRDSAARMAGDHAAVAGRLEEELAQMRAAMGRAAVRLATVEGALADSEASGRMQEGLLAEREAGLADLADLRDGLMAERVALIGEIERLGEGLAARGGELAAALDALRARERDLARAGRRRARALAGVAALRARRAALTARVAEAEGWVWRLAGERRRLEQQVAQDAGDLDAARRGVETGAVRERMLAQALAEAAPAQIDTGEHEAEIARLSAQLSAAEQAGEAARAELAREQARGQALSAREEEACLREDEARAQAGRDLAERYGEIATLTAMLREAVEVAQRRDNEMAWMKEVWAAARRAPWWARWPMPGWLSRLLGARGWARRRGLFDAAAYLAAYPDVAASGRDALDHYIAHGMGEGRVSGVQGA